MSKRASGEEDFRYMLKKIRKLEKKIRNRRSSSSSSTSSSNSSRSSPCPNSQNEFEANLVNNVRYYPQDTRPPREQASASPEPPAPTPPAPAPPAPAPLALQSPAPPARAGPSRESRPFLDETAATQPPITEPSVPPAMDETTGSGTTNVLDTELLDILGEDPSVTVEFGPDLHREVASRFAHIATLGLDKETRKQLCVTNLIPNNCRTISAPELNAEIKAALADQIVKRDKAIEVKQKQIASTIVSLGKVISNQLNGTTKNHELIKDLMNTGRLLCDLQHSESVARRNFALASLKKDLKDQISNTKIDRLLFGENLNDTLRSAKAIFKSSSDLKLVQVKKHLSKSKNWKARSSATTRSRHPPTSQAPPRLVTPAAPPPPASATHRGSSSHVFTQRSRPTRRQ